jgi:hypothetical protein
VVNVFGGMNGGEINLSGEEREAMSAFWIPVCVCLCFSVCRLMEWLKQERLRSRGLE